MISVITKAVPAPASSERTYSQAYVENQRRKLKDVIADRNHIRSTAIQHGVSPDLYLVVRDAAKLLRGVVVRDPAHARRLPVAVIARTSLWLRLTFPPLLRVITRLTKLWRLSPLPLHPPNIQTLMHCPSLMMTFRL